MLSKIFSAIMSLILMILSLFDSGLGVRTGPKQLITYDDTNKTVIISLAENRSSGYMWEYDISDPLVIKVSSDKFTADYDNGTVQAPGTREVSFQGLKTGDSVVTFNYIPSWEDVPARIVKIKITVYSDLSLQAEEVKTDPVEPYSTDVDQIVAYYNAAYAATGNQLIGMESVRLNGRISGAGAVGALLRLLSPSVRNVLARGDHSVNKLPGYPPILAEDVTAAAAYRQNGVITLVINLKDQPDGMNSGVNSGPVGRGIGTLGNLDGVMKTIGATFTSGTDTVGVNYQNAAINVSINENTGSIVGGTWSYRAHVHIGESKVKLNFVGFTVKNVDAELLYSVTF